MHSQIHSLEHLDRQVFHVGEPELLKICS
jgi:hypothetical protein